MRITFDNCGVKKISNILNYFLRNLRKRFIFTTYKKIYFSEKIYLKEQDFFLAFYNKHNNKKKSIDMLVMTGIANISNS